MLTVWSNMLVVGDGLIEGLVSAARTLIQPMSGILRGQRFSFSLSLSFGVRVRLLRLPESFSTIETHPETKRGFLSLDIEQKQN